MVLEGLDAAGKSTQSDELCHRLRSRGQRVLQSAEPSDGPYGRAIRTVLSRTTNPQPHYLALLYAADRALHLYDPTDGFQQFLEHGWVVCSRYIFSSFAYQREVVDHKTIATYNRHFPLPQYLIYLDITPELSEQRLARRTQQRDMFEQRTLLTRVARRYQHILTRYAKSGMRIVRAEATHSSAHIADQIWRALLPEVEAHPPPE